MVKRKDPETVVPPAVIARWQSLECRACRQVDRCPLPAVKAALCGYDCRYGAHRYPGDHHTPLNRNRAFNDAIRKNNDDLEQRRHHYATRDEPRDPDDNDPIDNTNNAA